MKLRSTRLTVSGLAATAVLVAGTAAPALAADAPLSSVPTGCYDSLVLLTADNTLGYVSLDSSQHTLDIQRPAAGSQPLGFTPEYASWMGAAGDDTGYSVVTYWMKDPKAGLVAVTNRTTGTGQPSTLTVEPVAGDVAGRTDLKTNYPYAYALTTSGKGRKATTALTRSTYDYGTGVGAPATIAQGNYVTLSVTGYAPGGDTADQVFTTTTDGQLVQTTVPYATPTNTSVTTLASGFGGLTGLSVNECAEGTGQTLLGIDSRGRVALWYDANRDDRSGADIVRIDTAGLKLGKGEHAYRA